jgi:hypothetical protein
MPRGKGTNGSDFAVRVALSSIPPSQRPPAGRGLLGGRKQWFVGHLLVTPGFMELRPDLTTSAGLEMGSIQQDGSSVAVLPGRGIIFRRPWSLVVYGGHGHGLALATPPLLKRRGLLRALREAGFDISKSARRSSNTLVRPKGASNGEP